MFQLTVVYYSKYITVKLQYISIRVVNDTESMGNVIESMVTIKAPLREKCISSMCITNWKYEGGD